MRDVGSVVFLSFISVFLILFGLIKASPVLVPLSWLFNQYQNSQYDPNLSPIENYHLRPTYENMRRAHEAGQLYRYDSRGNRINSRDEACHIAQNKRRSQEEINKACAHLNGQPSPRPVPQPRVNNRMNDW